MCIDLEKSEKIGKEIQMLGSLALGAAFDAADDSLRILYLALEGEDIARVVAAGDSLSELRRELAAAGLVDSDE